MCLDVILWQTVARHNLQIIPRTRRAAGRRCTNLCSRPQMLQYNIFWRNVDWCSVIKMTNFWLIFLSLYPAATLTSIKNSFQGIEVEVFGKKTSLLRSGLDKGLMVLICPFIIKVYHRLLLIWYFKIDKLTGKSRFQGKATWVSVVAVYRNTMYI